MKKSSAISIGLLALSLAACKQKSYKHPLMTRRDSVSNYYITSQDDNFFYPFYYHYPYFFNRGYYYGSGGRIRSTFGYTYSRGNSVVSRGYSTPGRVGSFSRGGFGSTGHGGGE